MSPKLIMTILRTLTCALCVLKAHAGFGAKIERVNSEGTVLIVTFAPDENFKSGDMVFIGIDDKFRTTGVIKIEKDGKIYVKANESISHLSPGDDVILSHDISWIRRGTDYRTNIMGKVAMISKQLVYVIIDEAFLPAFGLDEAVELQIEDNLETVSGTVRAYRKNGLWFKVPENLEKLSVGSKVLLLQKRDENIPTHSRLDTSHTNAMFYSLGVSTFTINEAAYSGGALSILYEHDFRVAKLVSIPLMGGLGYERASYSKSGGTATFSSPSFDVRTGARYLFNDQWNFSLAFEYDTGFGGSVDVKVGDVSATISDVRKSTMLYGMGAAYQVSKDLSVGLDILFSSGQLSVPASANSTASSDGFTGSRELITLKSDL